MEVKNLILVVTPIVSRGKCSAIEQETTIVIDSTIVHRRPMSVASLAVDPARLARKEICESLDEHAYTRRKKTVVAIHHISDACFGGPVRQELLQLSGRDRFACDVARQIGDTDACDRGVQQRDAV